MYQLDIKTNKEINLQENNSQNETHLNTATERSCMTNEDIVKPKNYIDLQVQ